MEKVVSLRKRYLEFMKKLNIGFAFVLMGLTASGQILQPSTQNVDALFPKTEKISRYHNTWTQMYYPKRIQEFKQDPLSFEEVVFIGNSITEGGKDWSSRFGLMPIRNRGIAGDVS